MKTSIVSDTSSLILLARLNRFDLLERLFDKVIIPQRVMQETLVKNDKLSSFLFDNPLFEIVTCSLSEPLNSLDGILDYGEAEAIALALELNHILLIDEKKGRAIAQRMGLKIIGFLGILLLHYKKELLTRNQVLDIIQQAKEEQFRLSDRLEKAFFALLG